MLKQNPPNILLRGCTRSNEAIQYIQQSILQGVYSETRPREESVSVPGFNDSKSANIIRWPWGIQIWVSPYRTRSDKWWNSLLTMLSSRSVVSDTTSCLTVKLIVLCAVDTAPSQIQMVLRARLEDDHKTVRYILTGAADTYLERSLESRCVVMVPKIENRWDDAVLYLQSAPNTLVSWDQVKNAWLADIPAYRVLDAIYEPAMKWYVPKSNERKQLVSAWCRYADLLKSCYQEITILRKAWEWIHLHLKTHAPTEHLGKSLE
jgi:hypothetical protein